MIADTIETIKAFKSVYKHYAWTLLIMYIRRRASYKKDVKINLVLKDERHLSVPYGLASQYASLKEIKNKNISQLGLAKDVLTFSYNNHPVILDPSRFSDPAAVFFREDYKSLDVKDKDVIDVGMNIGDSAIYFALNGAKRVIGLEPYPYAFSFAKKNVKLNNITNIILLNSGYGKDSKVLVDADKISSNGSTLNASCNGGIEIQIRSLKTLLAEFGMNDIILKMDCEGCEYALLDEDIDTLKSVEMIQLEYHYGYQKIVSKLMKSGFDVKYTMPVKSYNPNANNPEMEIGYIYAKRIR